MTITTTMTRPPLATPTGTFPSGESRKSYEILDPRIQHLFEKIRINPDCESGFVDGDLIQGDSPKNFEQLLGRAVYVRFHAGIQETPTPSAISHQRGDADIHDAISEATTVKQREYLVTDYRQVTEAPGREQDYIAIVDGLSVHVPKEKVVREDATGLWILRSTLNHRLSVGFTFYTGQLGRGQGRDLIRLYRKAEAVEELLPVWTRLIEWGQQHSIPFRMKMLNEHQSFPRNDALVLYMTKNHARHLNKAAQLMSQGTSELNDLTSPFAQQIAPGVGLSWEPLDPSPYKRFLSFGEHRSAALAQGLCLATRKGTNPASEVARVFLSANIDPLNPHRNLTSPQVML